MHDIAAEGLHGGLGLVKGRGGAAAEHRQCAVVGGLLTEHDGRIEDADALGRADLLKLLGGIDRA